MHVGLAGTSVRKCLQEGGTPLHRAETTVTLCNPQWQNARPAADTDDAS
jgi:hypothetical protein